MASTGNQYSMDSEGWWISGLCSHLQLCSSGNTQIRVQTEIQKNLLRVPFFVSLGSSPFVQFTTACSKIKSLKIKENLNNINFTKWKTVVPPCSKEQHTQTNKKRIQPPIKIYSGSTARVRANNPWIECSSPAATPGPAAPLRSRPWRRRSSPGAAPACSPGRRAKHRGLPFGFSTPS